LISKLHHSRLVSCHAVTKAISSQRVFGRQNQQNLLERYPFSFLEPHWIGHVFTRIGVCSTTVYSTHFFGWERPSVLKFCSYLEGCSSVLVNDQTWGLLLHFAREWCFFCCCPDQVLDRTHATQDGSACLLVSSLHRRDTTNNIR